MGKPRIHTLDGSDAEDPITQGYVKHLQKLLNSARRVDARTRKLAADRDHKKAQWEAFQSALRAKFLEQRQLHSKETKAIDKEMEELAMQKQDCLRQIHAAVAAGSRPPTYGDASRQHPTAEELEAWNSFMDMSPPQANTPEDAIIKRALQAAHHLQAFLAGCLESGQTTHLQTG